MFYTARARPGWGRSLPITLPVYLGPWLIVFLCLASPAALAAPATPDPLTPPTMSNPPTRLELGHYTYYLHCMACHGNAGQGLTDSWRAAAGMEDANCWQSKCHAANHPPQGFQLPTYAPPVIGEGRLARFESVGDLFDFVRGSMPWQAPGTLAEEEYRLVTLFLAAGAGTQLPAEGDWNQLARRPMGRAPSGTRPQPWTPAPWLLVGGALGLVGRVAGRWRREIVDAVKKGIGN